LSDCNSFLEPTNSDEITLQVSVKDTAWKTEIDRYYGPFSNLSCSRICLCVCFINSFLNKFPYIFISYSLIFLLHVPSFISVRCFSRVILIILREIYPCLKWIPVLIKPVHLVYWCSDISYVWNWLLLCKPCISLEHFVKHIEEVVVSDIIWVRRHLIIKWQRWVILPSLWYINQCKSLFISSYSTTFHFITSLKKSLLYLSSMHNLKPS